MRSTPQARIRRSLSSSMVSGRPASTVNSRSAGEANWRASSSMHPFEQTGRKRGGRAAAHVQAGHLRPQLPQHVPGQPDLPAQGVDIWLHQRPRLLHRLTDEGAVAAPAGAKRGCRHRPPPAPAPASARSAGRSGQRPAPACERRGVTKYRFCRMRAASSSPRPSSSRRGPACPGAPPVIEPQGGSSAKKGRSTA